MSLSLEEIEKTLQTIQERNKRVEDDKARETSRERKIIIALLTYAVIIIFFYTARLPNPRINAIVPTIGFVLSTLGLSTCKKLRLKHKKK
jgi:uncharacterized DUF497 family protein